jgi:hypothetical protein
MATAADNEGRDGNTTSLLYQTCHRQLVAQDKERLAKLNVPVSDDEADRLHFLRATNLLDTPQSDAMFDRFCSLTKRLFNVPFALINLIDVDRAFVKSIFGLPGLKEAPRDQGTSGPALPQVLLCAAVPSFLPSELSFCLPLVLLRLLAPSSPLPRWPAPFRLTSYAFAQFSVRTLCSQIRQKCSSWKTRCWTRGSSTLGSWQAPRT